MPVHVARGQRKAIETIRWVMTNLPPVSGKNPLGLLLDEQGQVPSIAVEEIPGEDRPARFN